MPGHRRRSLQLLVAAILILSGCAGSNPTMVANGPLDLISDIEDPLVISHRGGSLVYPEHSMEGYTASADAGFAVEPDLQFLADGTPVAIHDPDVDRTMTGITGSVSDLTLAQWQSGRIQSPTPGGSDAKPVTFAKILDSLGGDALLVPEVKPTATPSEVQTVIDMVKEQDLDRAVLMQSFTYSAVQQMSRAGLDCLYLQGRDLPPEPLEQLREEGVEWIGADRRMDPADVRQLVEAGFRVVAYTITATSELDELPAEFSGYFSDDPWAHAEATAD